MLGKANEEADQANLPDFKDWHNASPVNTVYKDEEGSRPNDLWIRLPT